jgi:hypothetical protein
LGEKADIKHSAIEVCDADVFRQIQFLSG